MKDLKNSFFQTAKVVILALLFGLGIGIIQANWTPPSAGTVAPANNTAAPLHVGALGQAKAGGLSLNSSGAVNGLIVEKGNVGIGTVSPAGKLDVKGNTIITGALTLKDLTGQNTTSLAFTPDTSKDSVWLYSPSLIPTNLWVHNGTFKYEGTTAGTPAVGKVLTSSDTVGNATWTGVASGCRWVGKSDTKATQAVCGTNERVITGGASCTGNIKLTGSSPFNTRAYGLYTPGTTQQEYPVDTFNAWDGDCGSNTVYVFALCCPK